MVDYDVLTYLLDRANIEDIVTKIGTYVDLRRFTEIGTEAFAESVEIDYTSIFGEGEPYTISGGGQADLWKNIGVAMDNTHHIATNILIDLPQPGKGVAVPQSAKLVANYTTTLVRKAARGNSELIYRGRFLAEAVRTEKEGNPWRIYKWKAENVSSMGNHDVLHGGK